MEALREAWLAADDGARIRWFERGSGPPLLLAGGLVGHPVIWRALFENLDQKHRLIGWDYRGLGRSRRPDDMTNLTIEWLARDGGRVLDAAEEPSAVVIGWSAGVQVCFEMTRRWPERVKALVVICGTYGRAFESALSWRGTQHVIPRAARAATELRSLVSSTLGRVAGSRRLIRYLKLTRAVAPTADDEALRVITKELADIDVTTFMTIVRNLEHHDATELLEHIDVPVLIIAGDRDVLVPPQIARKMARRIPEAELLIVPGATHYAPIEYPELITLRIEKFLREIGYEEPHDLQRAAATP